MEGYADCREGERQTKKEAEGPDIYGGGAAE